MPSLLITVIFWAAVATVCLAQVMILRSTRRVLRAAAPARPALEWGFALVPALVLVVVLLASWRAAVRPPVLEFTRGAALMTPSAAPASEPVPAPRSLWSDLISLTKPRIISLLLVTTIAPMFVAGRPSLATVLWVALGGYLMAGGANAVNMYLDQDIDDVMARTKLRPIPSGRMEARAVIAFGVGIATAATWLLATFVNILTAALALGGFYFYVFIYTRWLKRSSPQNIVIGGAAGAFPPLVGWAAVTGSLDLTALFLFLIVFYWTPPHFWALALNKQRDYGNARVPMAPLVWGERETIAQMWWYTVLLVGLTVIPVAFGAFGLIYLGSALMLGGLLLQGVWRVKTASDYVKPAWWVYGYSLLYLALLFVAMVIDHAV
jgi:protoheme IX farnesyltransferase